MSRRTSRALAAAAVLLGCTAGDGDRPDASGETAVSSPPATAASDPSRPPAIRLPPANADWDYQLGGAYDPPPGVAVLARDRLAAPDPDRYTICYVNGFQTQPDERAAWLRDHRDLVLTDGSGTPLTDPDWPDEMILDPSTPSNRERLAAIVGPWIDRCATDGFDAVEIDNLDTFTRFPDRLTEDATVAYARLLSGRAHAAGLAIAQKNTVELLGRRAETGFDFAVVEECNAFDECGAFTDAYGDRVFVIEYEREAFEVGCRARPQLSIVLRDRDVSVPTAGSYVRDSC